MAQEEARGSKNRRPTVVVIPEGVGGPGGNSQLSGAPSSLGGAEQRSGAESSVSPGRGGQRRGTDASGSLGRAGQRRTTETSSGQSTMRRVAHARNSSTAEMPLGATNPSLTIYREQYCCLSRRTRLERLLFGLVTLLAVVILLLFLIVMLVILPQGSDDEGRSAPLLPGALPWTSTRDIW